MYSSVYRTGYGTGRTGEAISVWTGARQPGGIPLICCHGFLGSATQAYDVSGTPSPETWRAAEAGVVTLWPDLGLGDNGLNNWGHDDTTETGGAIDDAIQWAHDTYGTRTDKVGIYGTSMGGTAIGWCWRNPARLAAAAFTIPCVALAKLHQRNPIGLASFIELAYAGEGGLSASLLDHDPSHPVNVAKLKPLSDQIRLWYSSNDNVIAAEDVQAFAAATGITATNVGAVGHSLAFDQRAVFGWLLPRLTRRPTARLTVSGLTIRGDLTRSA